MIHKNSKNQKRFVKIQKIKKDSQIVKKSKKIHKCTKNPKRFKKIYEIKKNHKNSKNQ